MKKNILIGIFSPLFYFLVVNIMRYTILAGEYNEEFAIFQNAGYIGLYGGLDVEDIHKRKGLAVYYTVSI